MNPLEAGYVHMLAGNSFKEGRVGVYMYIKCIGATYKKNTSVFPKAAKEGLHNRKSLFPPLN